MRILAAEIWIKGVSEGSLDVATIGAICGKMACLNFYPFKRLIDTIMDQLFQFSPAHNKALELFVETMIKELPYTPLRYTKKLLEIYQEVKVLNSSSVSDPRIREKLSSWHETSSLKKISEQLIAYGKAA